METRSERRGGGRVEGATEGRGGSRTTHGERGEERRRPGGCIDDDGGPQINALERAEWGAQSCKELPARRLRRRRLHRERQGARSDTAPDKSRMPKVALPEEAGSSRRSRVPSSASGQRGQPN